MFTHTRLSVFLCCRIQLPQQSILFSIFRLFSYISLSRQVHSTKSVASSSAFLRRIFMQKCLYLYVYSTPPLTIRPQLILLSRHYSPCPSKHTLNVLKMIFQSTQKLRSLTYFTSRSIHSSKERSLRCGAICQ
mgnify:CR=1 FL=1